MAGCERFFDHHSPERRPIGHARRSWAWHYPGDMCRDPARLDIGRPRNTDVVRYGKVCARTPTVRIWATKAYLKCGSSDSGDGPSAGLHAQEVLGPNLKTSSTVACGPQVRASRTFVRLQTPETFQEKRSGESAAKSHRALWRRVGAHGAYWNGSGGRFAGSAMASVFRSTNDAGRETIPNNSLVTTCIYEVRPQGVNSQSTDVRARSDASARGQHCPTCVPIACSIAT